MKDKPSKPLFSQERERPDDRLACALHALAESVKLQTEFLRVRFDLATIHDLKQMEKHIMAEVTVVKAQLQEAVASAKQTNLDIKEVQGILTANTAKIAELEAAIAAGGSGIPQDVADLVTEVRDLNKAADDALPNPVVLPPVV